MYSSVGSAFENIEIHLSWIGSLKLYLNSVKLSLEPVLRARVDHLASHSCCVRRPCAKNNNNMRVSNKAKQDGTVFFSEHLPCDEEDLALLATLSSDEIEIENGVTAFISRKRSCKVIMGLTRLAELLNNHLFLLLLDLVNDETESPFSLEFEKLELAVIMDCHT